MANYTRQNLESDLKGLVGGTDLAKITNLNSLIQRAARKVISRVDPPATKRKHLIKIFNEVYDYAVPSDDDFKYAFDLRPQSKREADDNFTGKFSETFDRRKRIEDALLSVDWEDGTQFFRIDKDVNNKDIELDNFNEVGDWSAQGDGNNLTQDTVTKFEGSASLNFDLDGNGTTGGIENTSLTSTDLSDHEDLSSWFLAIYFPNSSIITDVSLRWGSSNSDYWEVTVTSPQLGSSFTDGWQLLQFDWNGASSTGSPDSSAITYSRINITYDGTAETDIRVDELVSKIGQIYELWYYSKFLFRDSSGNWKETISDGSDIINLDTDGQNILLYECEMEAGRQLRDGNMKSEARISLYGDGTPRNPGLYREYEENHPSEKIKKRGTYYRV